MSSTIFTTPPYPDIPSPDQTIFDLYAKYWSLIGNVDVKVEVHRPLWITLFFFGTVIALLGNTLILIAAKQRAINLDNVTTTLIQHVAISDILNTLIVIFPTFLTVTTDHWLFGKEFCYFRAITQVPLQTHSMLLVCALNCAKLAFILFPLRSDTWRRRYGHIIAGITCLVSWVPLPISIILVKTGHVKPMFNFESITCEFMVGQPSRLTSTYAAINFTMITGSTALVVGTTIWLTVIATRMSKARGNQVKLRGVVTVISIAILFCLSFLPVTAVYVVFLMGQKGFTFSDGFYQFLFTRGRTLAIHVIYLNNIANVFIYFASIASFRGFVRTKFRFLFSHCYKGNRVGLKGGEGGTAFKLTRRATETIDLTVGIPVINRTIS